MTQSSVVISHRFRGPETSGNGGYSAGVVADFISGAAEITLRAPPPLEVPLTVEASAERVVLSAGEQLIAEGLPVSFELDLPIPPSSEDAERAERGFPGYRNHIYPECFVCGTARAPHDGLCLFPGPVEGRELVAARFRPDSSLCDDSGLVSPRYLWSALDCPSWWAYSAFYKDTGKVLLGRLAAKLLVRPRADEQCVVVAWPIGREGRRILSASALFGEQGRALAYARATWVELKK